MARYRMVTQSRALPGREAEYERWYDEVHLPEVLQRPGLLGAQRFRLAMTLAGEDVLPFLTIYEIETDDLGGTLATMNTGLSAFSPALDPARTIAAIYDEAGARVTGAAA